MDEMSARMLAGHPLTSSDDDDDDDDDDPKAFGTSSRKSCVSISLALTPCQRHTRSAQSVPGITTQKKRRARVPNLEEEAESNAIVPLLAVDQPQVVQRFAGPEHRILHVSFALFVFRSCCVNP
eukprot:691624-Rhodomonas_salina.2